MPGMPAPTPQVNTRARLGGLLARALALLVFSSACGRDTGQTADTTMDSASAPASVDPVGWTSRYDGLGPLRTGMTLAQAQGVAGSQLTLPAQVNPDQCDYATWPQAPRGVHLMFTGGVLARIDVDSATIATPEGVRVGDLASRADSVYGLRALRRPHQYDQGSYLIMFADPATDTIHRLVIEVVRDTVQRWRVGQFPQVEYVEGCS